MKISVIVPVYKVEKYLSDCVESILAQTHKDLEIILVDDGSPDRCGAMCDEFAKRDSRVRVIHKENGGISDARNAGLAVCTGDYIGFVDSDDRIASDMYESLAAFAEKEDLDVAMCGTTEVWPDHESGTPKFPPVVITDTETLLKSVLLNPLGGYIVPVWCRIYRASRFKDLLFEKGRYYEDGFYFIPWILRTRRFGRFSDRKYFYYHREGSITNVKTDRKRFVDFREAYEQNMQYIRERYPQLTEAGEYRLWNSYRDILILMDGADPEYCREISGRMRENLGRFWKNPYLKTDQRFNLSIMALDVDLYYKVRRAGVAWRRFLGKN